MNYTTTKQAEVSLTAFHTSHWSIRVQGVVYKPNTLLRLAQWSREVIARHQVHHRLHHKHDHYVSCSVVLTHPFWYHTHHMASSLSLLHSKSLETACIKRQWPISITGFCHTVCWDEHKKVIYFTFNSCLCPHTPLSLLYEWLHCLAQIVYSHGYFFLCARSGHH